MKILFLGGTRFLGRHAVDAALARGHDVTIMTRGRTAAPWSDAVRHVVGDRDPAISPGLALLEGQQWDAVVDTSGYVPRVVRAATRALATRVGRYLFVSSISAYADESRSDQDESTLLAVLADPLTEDIPNHYGALKAQCEREVEAVFGDRATIVRPGLIVGPYDATDRFGYWVARFLAPGLIGDRGADAVVPDPPSRPIQFIDARDLGRLMIDLVERGTSGAFNATSQPRAHTFGALVDTLVECGEARGQSVRPAWVDEARLAAHGVEPWTGLPLWIPLSDAATAGFMEWDCTRAHAHGLTHRPLAETIDDTADWLETRANSDAWKSVLGADAERELLRS